LIWGRVAISIPRVSLPLIAERPVAAPHLKVSEIFESIQGEGVSAGLPCLFVRLATCNLSCGFCDTAYSWDFDRHDYEHAVREQTVAELGERIATARSDRLVLTGGEPLLQQKAVVELFKQLTSRLFIEVETNGTVPPLPELAARVNQWNVSPKLANSGEPHSARIRAGALLALKATGRAWLKLVVQSQADMAEADGLIAQLDWPRDRVLFMPKAATREELQERAPLVALGAVARGYRFSPRLHIELWGGRRGV